MGQRRSSSPVLGAINEATKWAVSLSVAVLLLARRDDPVMWCVVGAVLSSFLNKVLKRVINQSRPDSARKKDPGMPSSHANSLAFLAAYGAASVLHSWPAPKSRLVAAGIMGGAAFLAWLRVELGYHTVPQVAVGFGLGSCCAAAWLQLGLTHALPALEASVELRLLLRAATLLAVAAFGWKNLLRKVLRALQQRQQRAAA